jgi:hypothetical protein
MHVRQNTGMSSPTEPNNAASYGLDQLTADERVALALSAPASQDALAALMVIWKDLGQIPHRCSDPQVARTRLEWWQRELERLDKGNAQHPATQNLQRCGRGDALTRVGPALIEAVALEIDGNGTADEATLFGHLDARHGGLLVAVASVISDDGAPGAHTAPEQPARDYYAAACGLIRHRSGDPAMIALEPRSLGPVGASRSESTLTILGNSLFSNSTYTVSGFPFLGALLALAGRRAASPEAAELGPLQRLWVAWRAARRAA